MNPETWMKIWNKTVENTGYILQDRFNFAYVTFFCVVIHRHHTDNSKWWTLLGLLTNKLSGAYAAASHIGLQFHCAFFLFVCQMTTWPAWTTFRTTQASHHIATPVRVATVWLSGNVRTFHELSTTFSRPIAATMYHIRQWICYHIKTLIAYI